MTTRSVVKRGVLGDSEDGSRTLTLLPALDSSGTSESHPAISARVASSKRDLKAARITTPCVECSAESAPGSDMCQRHLRGLALVLLDRAHWPRLQVNGKSTSGDDAWRPWLRAAKAEQLRQVVQMLEHHRRPG